MRFLAVIGLPFALLFAYHLSTVITIAASSAAQDAAQDSPKPIPGSLSVGGGEFHYEIRGDGTPIVLLSGGPGFGNYLQAVADALAPGHRCILFDQRGCGASQWEKLDPEPLTLTTAVADLEALRIHLKLERWSMLGHSWGGMLAMAYATQHSDRLDSLALVGTGGPTLDFMGPFGDTLAERLTPEERSALAKWNEPAAMAADPDRARQEQQSTTCGPDSLRCAVGRWSCTADRTRSPRASPTRSARRCLTSNCASSKSAGTSHGSSNLRRHRSCCARSWRSAESDSRTWA